MDYSNWIKRMLTVRDEMRMLDSENLYRYYPPNKCCSAEDILQVENRLKITLDKQYAEFLKCADGWREFFASISLLGTQELISSPDMDMAGDLLKTVYPLNPQLEFAMEDLLPIAVDEVGSSFFVITPPINVSAGGFHNSFIRYKFRIPHVKVPPFLHVAFVRHCVCDAMPYSGSVRIFLRFPVVCNARKSKGK